MEKLKRDAQGRIGQIPFVVIWTIGLVITQVIAGIVSSWLFSLMNGSVLEWMNPIILIGSLAALLVALVEIQIVERLLKRSMRGWMLFTVAGIVTTWALNVFFQQPFVLESPVLVSLYDQLGVYSSTVLNVFISTVPTALFQALWLRRQVRDAREAWLWPLTIITISAIAQGLQMYILSNPSRYDRDALPAASVIMLLIYSVVTGFVMHALISHPKERQKAKVDESDSNLVYSSRMTRLQQTGETAAADTSAYQPPKQQKTQ